MIVHDQLIVGGEVIVMNYSEPPPRASSAGDLTPLRLFCLQADLNTNVQDEANADYAVSSV